MAFLTAVSAPALASPMVLISDTFTRTGSLVGSTADTGQTWIGSGAFQTDGSRVIVDSNNAPRIGGLTLAPNKVYELCLDMSVESGGSSWIAFGFGSSTASNPFDASPAKMLHRQDPEIQLFGGASTQTIPAPAPFPKRLSVVLTTGATLANSSVSFLENNLPIGAPVSTDVSQVDAVFIQSHGGRGWVDNVTLTCVPEPSSMVAALLALTSTAAVGMRWRLG